MKLSAGLIIGILFSLAVTGQEELPIIRSNSSVVSIQDGDLLKKDAWNLAPEAKPDIYETRVIDSRPRKVTFISDVDSISFTVEEGKKYDFIIQWGDKPCYTQIVGRKFIPAAVFDRKYQEQHKGRISVEIPEVYELVNIAIALTPIGIRDPYMVYKNSEYYKRVRAWFDKYRGHPLLAELDKKLGNYSTLKMNGYSFEFDKNSKIVQSKIYDRTGFPEQISNNLRPFLTQLQSFSDATNFREFYKQNRKTYDEQISFYRTDADIGEMKKWLDKNFPSANEYDGYKIVFSPLVAYSQSSTWLESNGYKELQPHVNFPYPEDLARYYKGPELSESSKRLFRGNIVFTEINHGYINPEADKYSDRILKATGNRDVWAAKAAAANYPGISMFNEYMNWGLVSLRFVDYAPRQEQDQMIAGIDQMMTTRRGFLRFAEFDGFLVNQFRNRKPNQTIADLYPQIIEWFEKNNR